MKTPLLISLLVTASLHAEVIWRGDFETGDTSQWGGDPKVGEFKVVQEPVRQGKYALRIDGTNAAKRGKNDRIEFQHQPKPPGTAEGTERYFGWSVYVPKTFTNDHHAVGFFETRNSWRQLMSFEVKSNDIQYSSRVPYALRWKGQGKFTPGKWHDFVVHVLWSRDPNKGFIEVWFDGEKVVPLAKTATLLDENSAFFQIGLFRATSDTPESIIIDNCIEATTLADVMPNRYAGLDAAKFLGAASIETDVTTEKFFTEGPAVDAAGNVFFTNTGQILKWDPKMKKLTVFRETSKGACGLAFDPEGRLLVCEGGGGVNGRVTRTDMKTGQSAVLCDSFGGFPLGAPNDITLDAQSRIYFTSRLANTDPAKGNVNAVYRIDPDGRTSRILATPDIDMPNGLAISPDNKTFYLVESDGRASKARCIRAYDLQADGSVKNMRVVINFYPGRSGDGMRMDSEGNLVVAAGLHKTRGTSETLDTRPGIHLISPQGELLAFVETPDDTLTNLAFGGADLRTLYVTCGKHLMSLRTQIPGMPRYRPRQ